VLSEPDSLKARPLLERGAARFRELGATDHLGLALHYLARCTQQTQDPAAARPLYEEAMRLFRRVGDKWRMISLSLPALGHLERAEGNYARAAALYGECLALSREVGSSNDVAVALHNLGQVAILQGDARHAADQFTESLRTWQALGKLDNAALALAGLAAVAALNRQPARAARLLGAAADGLRRLLRSRLVEAVDSEAHKRLESLVRSMLDEQTLAELLRVGSAMTAEQAVAYAPQSQASGENVRRDL